MDKFKIGKKYFLPIVITIVIAVSWFGVLDDYSDKYTDDSIIQAGISYAVARGINGIVSVLQTSTVEVGVGLSGSMAFGEVLDPINDLIERFSHVMALALGSLVLQKILLGISAHSLFKILIAVIGVTLIIALLIKNTAVTLWVSRIFFVLIFIRFALVIVVSINSLSDTLFINTQITNGNEELKEFRADVIKLKNDSGNSEIDVAVYEEIIRVNRSKVDEINTIIIPGIKQELDVAARQLEGEEKNIDVIQGQIHLLKRWNPFSTKNKKINDGEQRLSKLKDQIDRLKNNREENEKLEKQLLEEIDESGKRIAGEPVDLLEKIKNGLPSISGLKRSLSLNVIGENITEAVSNIINLSVLFILKTILIPLAFFFIFIKGIKEIWKLDLTHSLTSSEKLTKG